MINSAVSRKIYERKRASVPFRGCPSLCNCDVWLFMTFLVTGLCGLRRVSRLPTLSRSSPGTHPPAVLTQKNIRMKHHWIFFFFLVPNTKSPRSPTEKNKGNNFSNGREEEGRWRGSLQERLIS